MCWIEKGKATVEDRDEIIAKALKLAQLDKELNGQHINSPYDLFFKGERYRAYVRHCKDSEGADCTRLEVIRPATVIAYVNANL